LWTPIELKATMKDFWAGSFVFKVRCKATVSVLSQGISQNLLFPDFFKA
jgi:hypothetical protein